MYPKIFAACCVGYQYEVPVLLGCSEWGGDNAGGYLNDVHAKVMVVTLAYVVLGSAFCEWCWTVKGRSQVHLHA